MVMRYSTRKNTESAKKFIFYNVLIGIQINKLYTGSEQGAQLEPNLYHSPSSKFLDFCANCDRAHVRNDDYKNHRSKISE